jgi:molybdopterin-guanine dinucleotide biosynthesis protein A
MRHLPPCDAFFLLPGDMPVIQPATFRLLSMRGAVVPVA